ncbi:hypothetical protein O9992_00845 [Vibrio lentus]|nr:hypothetical protein [Vibrio lentus]
MELIKLEKAADQSKSLEVSSSWLNETELRVFLCMHESTQASIRQRVLSHFQQLIQGAFSVLLKEYDIAVRASEKTDT